MSADLPTAAVKRAEEVEKKVVAAGTATEVQVLVGPGDGAPNFALRRFIMGEGGTPISSSTSSTCSPAGLA